MSSDAAGTTKGRQMARGRSGWLSDLANRVRGHRAPEVWHGADGATWVKAAGFAHAWEAEMAQAFLESYQVPTWMPASDSAHAPYPGASLTGYPVLVREEDAQRAADLLAAQPDDDAGEPGPTDNEETYEGQPTPTDDEDTH